MFGMFMNGCFCGRAVFCLYNVSNSNVIFVIFHKCNLFISEAFSFQAIKDKENNVEGLVEIEDSEKESVLDSVVKNVVWQMDQDR